MEVFWGEWTVIADKWRGCSECVTYYILILNSNEGSLSYCICDEIILIFLQFWCSVDRLVACTSVWIWLHRCQIYEAESYILSLELVCCISLTTPKIFQNVSKVKFFTIVIYINSLEFFACIWCKIAHTHHSVNFCPMFHHWNLKGNFTLFY